jgi:hypothetical protein
MKTAISPRSSWPPWRRWLCTVDVLHADEDRQPQLTLECDALPFGDVV